MAIATALIEEVVITTKEKKQTGVTLQLSMEEAEAIKSVLGKCSYKSPTGSVFTALGDAGVPSCVYEVCGWSGQDGTYATMIALQLTKKQ